MCNPILAPTECLGDVAGAVVGDAIENLATAVSEAVGKAVAALGTLWVGIGTPNLTTTGGGSSVSAGESAPDAENLTTVLGYVSWIGYAVALMAMIALGGLIATRMRRGDGLTAVGRVGAVLAGVVLIGASSGIIAPLLARGPQGTGGTVLFLQSSLWWYMGALAILSVIVGGIRMIWEQRADAGKDTLRSVLTLVIVAGAGVTITGLIVSLTDSFSVWILNKSLDCDVAADAACFTDNIGQLLRISAQAGGATPVAGTGALLVIVLGLFALLASLFQIVLMIARGGMLVVLAGVLPFMASFTNTEAGRSWFKKGVGWLFAFILYKPAAAIIYAAAFQLAGTDLWVDDGSGVISVITGVTLMVLALFAMPALMRFVTPLVGATAGGAGGGALAASAIAALPTGAAAIGRLASGSGGGGASSAHAASPPALSSTATPQGARPTGGSSSSTNSSTSTGVPGGAGSTPSPGAPGTAGSAGTGTGAGAAAGAGGGAAAGASGGAAAGAAAGPWGAAAGAALNGVTRGVQAATGAAKTVGENASGEAGTPNGSR